MPRFARTQGIVLRKYDFSESSHVLSVFTRDHGRVQLLAKGSRRLQKKRVPGFVDLLSRIDLVFIPKNTDSLSTLTEFDIVSDCRGIRGDLTRLGHAWLAAEIIHCAAQEFAPNRPLYSLVCGLFERLDHAPREGLPALMLAFEMRFLQQIGFAPQLDRCVLSGVPRARCRSPRFSPLHGGLLNGPERAADPRSFVVSAPVLGILESLGRGSWDAALRTRLPSRIRREARQLLTRNYQSLFERRMRVPRFLEAATLPAQDAVEGVAASR